MRQTAVFRNIVSDWSHHIEFHSCLATFIFCLSEHQILGPLTQTPPKCHWASPSSNKGDLRPLKGSIKTPCEQNGPVYNKKNKRYTKNSATACLWLTVLCLWPCLLSSFQVWMRATVWMQSSGVLSFKSAHVWTAFLKKGKNAWFGQNVQKQILKNVYKSRNT